MEVLDVEAIVLDPTGSNVAGRAFQRVGYFSEFIPILFFESGRELFDKREQFLISKTTKKHQK